uniref:Uncharacterized protein n=1 Tax=Monopterus albus TaxID=43700 RepID=A0A3Q3IYR8_MONAL
EFFQFLLIIKSLMLICFSAFTKENPIGLQRRIPGHQHLTGLALDVTHCWRGETTRRGLPGCHSYPGAAGVSGRVVTTDTELVLSPGMQTSHCKGEGVSLYKLQDSKYTQSMAPNGERGNCVIAH